MAEYTVNSKNATNAIVNSDGEALANLKYNKWLSFRSEITMANQSTLLVDPQGMWETEFDLRSTEGTLLTFYVNWDLNFVIKAKIDNVDQRFRVKMNNMGNYVLLDENKNELLSIKHDYSWRKWTSGFKITTTDDFEALSQKDILLLTALHCVNYHNTILTILTCLFPIIFATII